jgi:hypothetical protein
VSSSSGIERTNVRRISVREAHRRLSHTMFLKVDDVQVALDFLEMEELHIVRRDHSPRATGDRPNSPTYTVA